jgi:hypothetical protein
VLRRLRLAGPLVDLGNLASLVGHLTDP